MKGSYKMKDIKLSALNLVPIREGQDDKDA